MRKKTKKEKFHLWLGKPYMLLLYRIVAILIALSISRWMLYLFNSQYFHQLKDGQALLLFLYGMRFDLSVTVVINLPIILYYCFPSRYIFKSFGQRFIDFVYVIVNSVAILLNFIDIVCFNFLGKHITVDYINTLGRSGEVTFGIVRQVLFDYWFLLVIFILFVLVISVVARHTQLREENDKARWHLWQTVRLSVALVMTFVVWRGGFQKERITMQTALQYTDPQNAPIMLNTPFCLLSNDEAVPVKQPTSEPQFTAIHTDLKANRFIVSDSLVADTLPANVVIIITESIGQEMTRYYNPKREHNITPFLDSLLAKSLTFNGHAFVHTEDLPENCVYTTGTHDMPTLRGWLAEDRVRARQFLDSLDLDDRKVTGKTIKKILEKHCDSPSKWNIYPLQDLLDTNEKNWSPNPKDDQINVPADPKNKWCWRMKNSLEDMPI